METISNRYDFLMFSIIYEIILKLQFSSNFETHWMYYISYIYKKDMMTDNALDVYGQIEQIIVLCSILFNLTIFLYDKQFSHW